MVAITKSHLINYLVSIRKNSNKEHVSVYMKHTKQT